MNSPDHRETVYRPAEDAAMDTFTVRLPRWPVLLRLAGRNPLVRTIDRIEALAVVLAVVVSLMSIPIAAAMGTAIYDSSRQIYAEQAHTRHSVAATVTDAPASQGMFGADSTVSARWTAEGIEHTGTVKAQSTIKPGDIIEIWVDNTGAQALAPAPTANAAAEGAMAAVVIWMCVAAVAATLFTVTRTVCDRVRSSGWQHDLHTVVGDGDGRQYPGPAAQR